MSMPFVASGGSTRDEKLGQSMMSSKTRKSPHPNGSDRRDFKVVRDDIRFVNVYQTIALFMYFLKFVL